MMDDVTVIALTLRRKQRKSLRFVIIFQRHPRRARDLSDDTDGTFMRLHGAGAGPDRAIAAFGQGGLLAGTGGVKPPFGLTAEFDFLMSEIGVRVLEAVSFWA
jgi:hypothetical protein